jgi:peptidoglycan/LPS O-acetylase OafA/YrhL
VNKKFEYIDFFRGLAILLVVSVHTSFSIWYDPTEHRSEFLDLFFASIFYAGQFGVVLFFIVSAITLTLSMENRNESKYNFYIRRYFRIAPLYYFGILLYFAFRLAVETHRSGEIILFPEGYSLLKIIQNIFFIHGFSTNNYNFIVPGGWSISTEMYFYLIFPFIFILHKKYDLKYFVILTIVISSIALSIQYFDPTGTLKADGEIFNFPYTTLINHITIFLIGVITVKLIKINFSINYFHYILAFIFLFFSIYYINIYRLEKFGISFLLFLKFDTGFNGFFYPIFFALGMMPIIISISKKQFFENILFKQVIEVGKYSYCIYILHFMVLEILISILRKTMFTFVELRILKFFILFFICIIICFYLSKILSFIIEKPGINLGKKIIKK